MDHFKTRSSDHDDVDCPYFSEAWRLEHTSFPLDPRVVSDSSEKLEVVA